MGRTATDVTFLQKEGISALAATALVRGLPCWGSGSQASKKETAPDQTGAANFVFRGGLGAKPGKAS